MLWYNTPAHISSAMFVILLLTAVLQIIIAMESGDLIRSKRTLHLVRIAYALLAAASLALTAETLLAIASIEGGVFIHITSALRWTASAPVFFLLCAVVAHSWTGHPLMPRAASLLAPLLYLPPWSRLPVPLPVMLHIFAAVWLAGDAVWMLLRFRSYAKSEVTRSVMQHIVQNIDYGVCIANRNKWILESNPAFYKLCACMGIMQPERTDDIDTELRIQEQNEQIQISRNQNGSTVRTQNGVYFLQYSNFITRGRTFVQLALSDITDITKTTVSLEQENVSLEQKNIELERLIDDIEIEAAAMEREKICRMAHDFWSQRLAVAGLLTDMITKGEKGESKPENISEIAAMLSREGEKPRAGENFLSVLRSLTDMYGKLGVEINFFGYAPLTDAHQKTLCAVLREALANAVRHAYARIITVNLEQTGEKVIMTVKNDCIDDIPIVSEGRGIFDMRMRVQQIGGTLLYEKSVLFNLVISLPKDPPQQKEAL